MENIIGKIAKYNGEEYAIMAAYNDKEQSYGTKNIDTVVLAREDPNKRKSRYYPFDHIVSIYDIEIMDKDAKFELPEILPNGTIVKIYPSINEYNGRIGTIVRNDKDDCFPDLSDLNYWVKFTSEPFINNPEDSYDILVHMSEVEVVHNGN